MAKIIPFHRPDYRDKIIKNPNMTKYLEITLLIVISCILFSCGGKKASNDAPPPTTGETRLVGVVTHPDSTKTIDEVLRVITETIKYDSTKKEKVIVTDTIYGVTKLVDQTDSLGKPKLDSITKKPIKQKIWVKTSKDSIYILSPIPIDSLIKKS